MTSCPLHPLTLSPLRPLTPTVWILIFYYLTIWYSKLPFLRRRDIHLHEFTHHSHHHHHREARYTHQCNRCRGMYDRPDRVNLPDLPDASGEDPLCWMANAKPVSSDSGQSKLIEGWLQYNWLSIIHQHPHSRGCACQPNHESDRVAVHSQLGHLVRAWRLESGEVHCTLLCFALRGTAGLGRIVDLHLELHFVVGGEGPEEGMG